MIKNYSHFLKESLDLNYSYDYEYVETKTGVYDNEEYVEYLYQFSDDENRKYMTTISFYNFWTQCISMDFQDYESYLDDEKNNKGFEDRTYLNTNRKDSIKILNTVVKILKEFYDENCEEDKDIITHIVFTAEPKRLRIYKSIINRFFPDSEVEHEELGDDGEIFYQIELNV